MEGNHRAVALFIVYMNIQRKKGDRMVNISRRNPVERQIEDTIFDWRENVILINNQNNCEWPIVLNLLKEVSNMYFESKSTIVPKTYCNSIVCCLESYISSQFCGCVFIETFGSSLWRLAIMREVILMHGSFG